MRRFQVVRGALLFLLCLPALAFAQEAPRPPPPPPEDEADAAADAAPEPEPEPEPEPPEPTPAPEPIAPVPQLEFADGTYQMLAVPMRWSIGGSGVAIVVPDGFIHDNASIPQAFRWLLGTHGTYGKAAIVHDYLYWAQPCTRLQADNLLMVAMAESGVSSVDRVAIYRAVRAGGGSAFAANRAERAAGGVRVVPPRYRELPATATWHDYQIQLRAYGVRDPEFPASADYCRFGDTTDIPAAAINPD